MIKVNYPVDKSFLKDYHKCLNISNRLKVESFLETVLYNGEKLTFEEFVILQFNDLLSLMPTITHRINSLSEKEKKEINFDYNRHQQNIALFFMRNLSFMSCHYCGIDNINAFNDIADYFDGIDFINNASKDELMLIEGIGSKTADKIFSKREQGILKSVEDFELNKPRVCKIFCVNDHRV